MDFQTADLYDEYADEVSVATPLFRQFGTKTRFGGEIITVKCYEDNSLVRETLDTDGNGKVLIVDGGGSLRCALVGDRLATNAINNGWEGIIVYGCIRDSMVIDKMEIGLKAVNTNPTKSIKRGVGLLNEEVTFAGITFKPGEFVYADEDGILVSARKLV